MLNIDFTWMAKLIFRIFFGDMEVFAAPVIYGVNIFLIRCLSRHSLCLLCHEGIKGMVV